MLRDQILNASDVRVEPVEVPEWGLTLYVRTLSIREVGELQKLARQVDEADRVSLVPQLVCRSACDQQGNRIFGHDDAEALAEKNPAALARVADAAAKINGLAPDSVDHAGNA